jgi:hypothetical protein
LGKGAIVNSIPDLIIEWGLKHPNLSVRSFLMEVKGYSKSRYKRIMAHAPAPEWITRREEFQNRVAANTVQKHVDKAAEVHGNYINAANLAFAKTVKRLSNSTPLTSKELLDSVTTLEKSINVYRCAMGVPPGQGLLQIWEQVKAPEAHQAPQENPAHKYTYEEIKEMIEIRREQKKKLEA